MRKKDIAMQEQSKKFSHNAKITTVNVERFLKVHVKKKFITSYGKVSNYY